MNKKWLLFLVTLATICKAPAPHITVYDFSPETVQKLQLFSEVHKGPFTVEYANGQSWFESSKNYVTESWQGLKNSISFSNVAKSTVVFCLGFGWISYLLCGYVLYKGYKIAYRLNSWLSWCSDDEMTLLDEELLYERLAHKRTHTPPHKGQSTAELLTDIRREKMIIEQYKKVVTFLHNHGITLTTLSRYANEETEEKLTRGYKKLEVAEKLLLLYTKEDGIKTENKG